MKASIGLSGGDALASSSRNSPGLTSCHKTSRLRTGTWLRTRRGKVKRWHGQRPRLVTYPAAIPMLRAEVWWVDFDPSLGGEIKKIRPAVIVSNDASNRNLNRLEVVPITSNVSRLYPCEAAIALNGEPPKAMADQIATVSKQRLRSKVGALSRDDMQSVERAIRLQLDLSGF